MEALILEYFDRDGHRVSRQQWQELGRQPGYACVAHTDSICNGQHITVITYWLGISEGQQPGTPLIFQTYGEIRRPGGPHAHYYRIWSWPTLGAARGGHLAIIDWLMTLLTEPTPSGPYHGTTRRLTAATGTGEHAAATPPVTVAGRPGQANRDSSFQNS